MQFVKTAWLKRVFEMYIVRLVYEQSLDFRCIFLLVHKELNLINCMLVKPGAHYHCKKQEEYISEPRAQ